MKDVVLIKTRKEIYDSLWTIGATKTAKEYGIAYPYFKRQIDEANIVAPTSTYWVQLSLGKEVEKAALDGDENLEVELHSLTEHQSQGINPKEKNKDEDSRSDAQIDEEKIDKEFLKQQVRKLLEKENKPKDNFRYSYEFKEFETIKICGQVYNIYERDRLYEEVWNRTMVDVAKHYRVSDTTIRNICKDLNVPYPNSGHWNKVRAGIYEEQKTLPPEGLKSKRGPQNPFYLDKDEDIISTLRFMSEEEKDKVVEAAAGIRIPPVGTRISREITALVNNLENISNESRNRVALIVKALLNSLEPIGCKIDENRCFVVNGERVKITLSESKDKIDHELTKEENKKLLIYNEDIQRNYLWASKPTIRKYDYKYNGRLTLVCGNRRWTDSKNKIEDCLYEIVIAMFAEAERVRIARLEEEEEERKCKEEEQRKKERIKKYNLEAEKTKRLVNEAEDYNVACMIRKYVDGMKKAHPEAEIDEWID